ncbi:MAG: rod shape-determining protein MreC [Brevinematales bacterium]|nr:rod shape-determining protein MreC [Brevinematales bacterium]
MPVLTFTRRRTLLTMFLLCGISVALMVWEVKIPQVTVRSVFLFFLYPFQWAWSTSVRVVGEAAQRIVAVGEAQKSLSEAETEIRELQTKLLLLSQLEKENEDLRTILDIKKRVTYESLYTRIINKSLDVTSSRILIDRGIRDGVRRDSALIGYTKEHGFYVVGKVVEVNVFTSVVELLYSENFSMGGMLSNGALGVVSGQGGWHQYCVMSYVPNEALVEVGDVVSTTSESDIFPPGFGIGVVVGITTSLRQEFFKRLYVKPFFHVMQAQSLFVLKWTPQEEGGNRE